MPRNCFFARITRPYSDLSGVVAKWALRCERLIVYEHLGEETEKVHIHAAIYGAGCDKKTLKNDYKHLKLTGNEEHSWKEWDGCDVVITYMTKGELDPKYNKGYTVDQVNEFKTKWVPPKEHVKKTSWEKLYDEFEGYAPLPPKVDVQAWLMSTEVLPNNNDQYLDNLLESAQKFVKSKDRYVWSPSYPNRVKCCFYSFLFKYKITASEGWKKRNMKFAE